MERAPPSTSRPRTAVRRALLAGASALVGLLLADALHRAWRWQGDRPATPTAVRRALHESLATTAHFTPRGAELDARPASLARAVLTPYAGGEIEHDTGGVLRYWREEARESNFEILVLGGSVAASLAAYLQGDGAVFFEGVDLGGRRVVVLNYAHASYKQPQQVGRFSFLCALGHRPDVVLAIDGFNELALGLENGRAGVHPLYPSAPTWGALLQPFATDPVRYAALTGRLTLHRERALEILATADARGLWWSSLGSAWTERAVQREQRELARLQVELAGLPLAAEEWAARQSNGPDYARDTDSILAACVESWFEGSLSLQALCAARGVRYVHMLQPTLHDVDSKELHPAEAALPLPAEAWIEAAQRGYPLLRARRADLRARGVRFLDASRVLRGYAQPAYRDACHLERDAEAYWLRKMRPQLLAALFQA